MRGDTKYITREEDDRKRVKGQEFFSVPRKEIPRLVAEYLEQMRVGRTIDWCACLWTIHPDDVDLPTDVDQCKTCGAQEGWHPHLYEVSYRRPGHTEDTVKSTTCANYQQRQRRLHRKDEDPQCPVHTEAGRILGFFQYLFPEEKDEMDEEDDKD